MEDNNNVTTQETQPADTHPVSQPSDLSNFLVYGGAALLIFIVVLAVMIAGKRRRDQVELDSFVDDGKPDNDAKSYHDDDDDLAAVSLDEDDRGVKKK